MPAVSVFPPIFPSFFPVCVYAFVCEGPPSDVLDFVIVAVNRTIPFVVQGDMATLALSLHS